jgi:hypothetical protein
MPGGSTEATNGAARDLLSSEAVARLGLSGRGGATLFADAVRTALFLSSIVLVALVFGVAQAESLIRRAQPDVVAGS